jgi:thiamine phosphate synthase YjbQ (UPF0047 family)
MNKEHAEKLVRTFDSNITPSELAEILKDPQIRKDYFELMFIKTKLKELPKNDFPIPYFPATIAWKKMAPLLVAAASIFIVFTTFVWFNFFENTNEPYSRVVKSHGKCLQVIESKELVRYLTNENSFCDIEIIKHGKFSMRVFPNTTAKLSTNEKQLTLSIDSGSILFSSIEKEKNVNIEVHANHLRSILLGTSLYIKVTPLKEMISLVEGSLLVMADNHAEDRSKKINAGDLIQYDPVPENPISLKTGKLSKKEVESIKNLSGHFGSTGSENLSTSELETLSNFEKSNDYHDYPYVLIYDFEGNQVEGYLIELGDYYTLFSTGSGKLRMERAKVKQMETIR